MRQQNSDIKFGQMGQIDGQTPGQMGHITIHAFVRLQSNANFVATQIYYTF
jgi:hypothetical protein